MRRSIAGRMISRRCLRRQVLPTAKKLMQKDVTIRKIPQYEVSNDSSGYTLIIGEEYYNAQ